MALAKVRALHPDIFSDEDVCEVSIPARWLFAGLWCYACDNGHLADKPKQIKRWIFATDDENAAELLRELADEGLIQRADGWIFIPGLMKRQRVDWRWFKTCDREGCAKPEHPKKADSRPETRSGHAEPQRAHDETTRGHAADVDVDVVLDGDVDGEGDVTTPSRKRSETPERFDEFWDTYSHKVARAKAVTAYRAALKKPGVTPDVLITGAAAYIAWQMREGKHPTYTKHPATWLHQECWRDERTTTAPQTNTQRHLALARQLAEQNEYPQIGDGR